MNKKQIKYSQIQQLREKLPLYSGGSYDSNLFEKIRSRLQRDQNLADADYSKNSVSVLNMRYFRKDESGRAQEDTEGLLARVAAFVALPEYAYSGGNMKKTYAAARKFYNLMAQRIFMPNSPTLMNAGRGSRMLSGCFVLPVHDSIPEIFDSIGLAAEVQKAGGGTGFSFDELRPTGDYISSSGGSTSGPISFWRVFAEATNAIQQGAFRRGANMGMMSVWHPDIFRFMNAKMEEGQFSNFNISVKIGDKWMKELMSSPDSPVILRNPRTGREFYAPRSLNVGNYTLNDLIPIEVGADLSKVYTKQMLWNIIISNAHACGDPGIAFIDRMNRDNPTPVIGRIETTNPCGEQPLLSYEACNLGSVNLGMMIKDGKPDFKRLRETTQMAVRFLDNVIDVNNFPDPRIVEMASSNRKIGLGVMGWADMLASLKIRYDSDQAIELAEQIIKTIQEEAIASSQALAVERGPFPNFDKSIYAGEKPIRNAARTTIAPTGTISIIAGASAGIEPFFGNTYWHRDGEGNVRRFTNEVLRKDLEARAINADAVFEKLFKGARLDELKEIPEDIARTYVTSHELSVEKQIAMQAAFQKHIDNAASKTLNLVYEAPLETVDKAYRASFLAGNKGVTVYRNGCKDNQPIQFGRIEERQPAAPKKTLRGTIDKPIVVPEIMPAVRIRQDTPFGHVHATVVFDSAQEYMPVETFGLLGNAGSEEAAELEALGRSASLYLRSGGSLETVVDQYIGIGSGVEKSTRSGTVKSIAMGVGKALLKFLVARKYFSMEELLLGKVDYEQFSGEVADLIRTKEVDELLKANGAVRVQDFLVKENATSSERNGKRKSAFNERCPHCKAPLMRQEGCLKCPTPDCGFSRC